MGRNLRHLILLLDELTAVGVGFVSLNEGIDTTTPARRLQLHVLGAIAEFERERVRERVRAGLARQHADSQAEGNIAQGPQQVNNMVALARAENLQIPQNELLEAHGERLDPRLK